ncbi:hypothetical protein J4214_02840 [Candidatus Woesearchaeota archaeon]|nr:hypothetical protein [Candidatus Woesearchaeota archaeon]
MGLFSKKSDKINKSIEPTLPRLPDFPGSGSDSSGYNGGVFDNFPSYTPSFSTANLPSEHLLGEKKSYVPQKNAKMYMNGNEKPLFVKIENYKDAIKMLERMKEELRKTDDILIKLNEIRSNEERELETWHSEVRKLKDRLLEIDKKLFESEEA